MYFFLKEPNSNKDTIIYLIYYLKHEGKNFKYSTGQKISPEDWDPINRLPKTKRGAAGVKNKHISSVLSNYSSLLDDTVQDFERRNEILTKTELKSIFDFEFKKKSKDEEIIYFSDFINDFNDNHIDQVILKSTNRKLSERTKKGYKTALIGLQKFEKKYKKVLLKDLTLNFHSKFMNFLYDEENLATNTVGFYIKNLKALAKHADRMGLKINDQVLSSDFFVPEEKSESVYLSIDEIEKLFKKDFSDRPRFQNVRDWAIISCWTGLRVSDWDKFGGIENGYIKIIPKKTQYTSGKEVVIPIHWQIQDILDKRGLPEKVSDVEFNRIFKDVCGDANIDYKVYGSRRNKKSKNRLEKGMIAKNELVSSHTCRRSFATNNYLMGIDTLTIMQVTGHTTEKSFLRYIKVTPDQHAKRLKEKWDKYYNQAKK